MNYLFNMKTSDEKERLSPVSITDPRLHCSLASPAELRVEEVDRYIHHLMNHILSDLYLSKSQAIFSRYPNFKRSIAESALGESLCLERMLKALSDVDDLGKELPSVIKDIKLVESHQKSLVFLAELPQTQILELLSVDEDLLKPYLNEVQIRYDVLDLLNSSELLPTTTDYIKNLDDKKASAFLELIQDKKLMDMLVRLRAFNEREKSLISSILKMEEFNKGDKGPALKRFYLESPKIKQTIAELYQLTPRQRTYFKHHFTKMSEESILVLKNILRLDNFDKPVLVKFLKKNKLDRTSIFEKLEEPLMKCILAQDESSVKKMALILTKPISVRLKLAQEIQNLEVANKDYETHLAELKNFKEELEAALEPALQELSRQQPLLRKTRREEWASMLQMTEQFPEMTEITGEDKKRLKIKVRAGSTEMIIPSEKMPQYFFYLLGKAKEVVASWMHNQYFFGQDVLCTPAEIKFAKLQRDPVFQKLKYFPSSYNIEIPLLPEPPREVFRP